MNTSNPFSLIIKGVFLVSPFLVVQALEMFILPIDFFTFRIWEAAVSPYDRFPGGFYPNLSIRKEKEYGDRYRLGGDYKQYKAVQWYTDPYGWRNRPEVFNNPVYDIVTLGDSNIVGSFLDQKDILAEVIARNSGLNAYNYSIGHNHIQYYFSDQRMAKKGTKLVVVESKVGNWLWTGDYLTNFRETEAGALEIVDRKHDFGEKYDVEREDIELQYTILRSRLKKQALYNRLRSELLIDTAATSVKYESAEPARDLGLEEIPINKVSNEGQNQKPVKLRLQDVDHVRGPGANVSLNINVPNDVASAHVSFEARVTTAPSKHEVWIISDGRRDILTQVSLSPKWKSYRLDLPPGTKGPLRIEVEHSNSWQYLGVRNAQAFVARGQEVAEVKPAIESDAKSRSSNVACTQYTLAKPSKLRPIEPPTSLDPQESNYYLYQAVKAIKKQTDARGQEFIFFLMPDMKTYVLAPAIRRLRCEGVKVIAYESSSLYAAGVDEEWYWNHADSHWREQAVNFTADEVLRMWNTNAVANRPYSAELASSFAEVK